MGTSATLDESVGSDVGLASLSHRLRPSGALLRTTSRIDVMTIDASSDAAYRSVWGGGQ
jgi:hypothetical protein